MGGGPCPPGWLWAMGGLAPSPEAAAADPPVTLKEEEPLLELLRLLLLKEVLEPELVLKDCRLELELEEAEELELNLDPELLDCKVCWTCWLMNPLSTK